MILVRLTGGLGNQMFQYAAARSLALSLNTGLKADLTDYDIHHLRKYELHCFMLNMETATPEEISNYRSAENNKNNSLLGGLFSKKKISFIRQPNFFFRYYEGIKKALPDAYLDGYWQSEKYFAHIEDVIRNDFRFRVPPSQKNKELAAKISEGNSVSIHIRRGDYISNEITKEFHGLCSVEYYSEAVKQISENVSDPVFYIFSDDPEWVIANIDFKGTETVVVDHNKNEHSYEDMRLMSLCKHNIIANSSFSWWAAWLNQEKNKMVIAPGQWFNPESKWFKEYKIDTLDIVPQGWIRINIAKTLS